MVNQTLSKYVVKEEDIDTTNLSDGDWAITFYRQFNMVICIYYLDVTGWNTSEHTVMIENSIPSAFRPSSDIKQNAINSESNIAHCLITIKDNGGMKLQLGNTTNSDIKFYGSISYIIEE